MGESLVIINHCNQWHEYASFRLIGVVTESQLEGALAKIQKKLRYSNEDMQSYIDCTTVISNELDI